MSESGSTSDSWFNHSNNTQPFYLRTTRFSNIPLKLKVTTFCSLLLEHTKPRTTTTTVPIPARAAHEVSMQAILFTLWNC
jgi:hypothetical protein